jgi:hypothetical protein
MNVPAAHGVSAVLFVVDACGLSLKLDLLAVTNNVMLWLSDEPVTVIVLPERVAEPTLVDKV